jgi:DNA-binding CsgD family transcriptional regulator
MARMKDQVIEILELWMEGYTFARIAGVTGLTPEVVQYVIEQYGEDVIA